MSRAYPCARQRRLSLPPEAELLLERDQLLELLHDLAAAVAAARPTDPLAFFLHFLEASQNIKFCPRIMLVPSEDTTRSFADVAAMMANMAGLDLLSREDLIREGVLSGDGVSRATEEEAEAEAEAEEEAAAAAAAEEAAAEEREAAATLLVEGPLLEAVAAVTAAQSTVRHAFEAAVGAEAPSSSSSSSSDGVAAAAAAAAEEAAAEAAALAATRCWGCARQRAGAASGWLLAPRRQASGWLLADAPASRAEAEAMRRAGVLPSHLLQMRELLCPRHHESPCVDGRAVATGVAAAAASTLTTSVEWAAARSRASCVRPQAHARVMQQACVHAGESAAADGPQARRHARGERQGPLLDEAGADADGVLAVFRHTPLIRVVEVHGGEHEQMALAALGHAFARRRPRGHPWLPRVALFGPECAGLRWHQQRLSYQFGLCPVDFLSLLREEPRSPQTSVERLAWTLPAERAAQLVAARLAEQDCILSGWALVGFPRHAEDLQHIDRTVYAPNRIFLFNNSAEWCLRRAQGGVLLREARAAVAGQAEPGVREMAAVARRLGARGEAALRDSLGYAARLAELRRACAGTATDVDGERGRVLVYHQLRAALAQAVPPVPPRACTQRAAGHAHAHFPTDLPLPKASPHSSPIEPVGHGTSVIPSAASVRSRLTAVPTPKEDADEDAREDALHASLLLV